MDTITKIRKLAVINDNDNTTSMLSDTIFEMTRGLYRYSVRRDYGTSAYLSNDELMQEFDLVKDVMNYDIDEVWNFGNDSGASMGGTNAFWIGQNPVRTIDHVHRRFPFMRFGGEPWMKTYAKRIENTMYRVYAGYPPFKNMWERFIRNEKTHPGHASIGSVTYPPNGIMEGYNSKMSFLSDCDDWKNHYPEFRDRVRFIDSSEWGGTMEGYLRWWMKHIPHGVHKTDGIHDNWWHYVMNLDLIK